MLTNLLPSDRIRSLQNEYTLRLLTAGVVLLGVASLMHAALLTPSYFYLSEEVKTREAHLEEISSSFQASEGQEVAKRAALLEKEAAALVSLGSAPSASSATKMILSVPRSGIVLQGIALTFPESGEGQVRLQGVASTRESLRNFHSTLSLLPSVSKADLPLSVYAEERDISFSITLSGTFTP